METPRHIDQLRNGPIPARQMDSDVEIPSSTEPEVREEQTPEPENGGGESHGNTALQPEDNSTKPEQEAADSSIRRYPS